MPEPLKNLYTEALITQLSSCLQSQYFKFDASGFTQSIFNAQWPDLELKQRMRHITQNLYRYLPPDYLQNLTILVNCSRQFNGFETMFFPEYVELYGQQEFEPSLQALSVMTQNSSAEFAVRPFIINRPQQMMKQMLEWSLSENLHVRRLSSEGCRPRLPWAMALPQFKQDPSVIFPILENLKDDDSEYVRRSVANNLNDISKDNPERVIKQVKAWKGNSIKTDWIIKHGCRTLLKQGHPDVMHLFGLQPPKHIRLNDFSCDKSVATGNYLNFTFSLNSNKPLGLCRIEYNIHHQKANGLLTPKIFKISESLIHRKQKQFTKKHPFKLITTRKYYSGLHQLEIIVNGHSLAKKDFYLE